MKKKILLIGMPYSGKSTLGKLIAKKLNYDFIDTDKFIESKEKLTLQTIINQKGIETARKLENFYLQQINVKTSVIATGGSAVYYPDAMKYLQKKSMIFFIDVSFDKLFKRINNFKTRGIIMKKTQTFNDIYKERLPLYHKYSQFTIKNDNKLISEIVHEILEIYKKNT